MASKRKLYSPPVLIGLMGNRGIGKTTTAKAVCDRYEGFRRMSFADAVRAAGNEYFANERIKDPVISRWLHSVGEQPFAHGTKDTPIPGLGITPRDILIEIGEGRRQDDPNVWVDKIVDQIVDFTGHVIIDDVRFENEVDFIHSAGGLVVVLVDFEDRVEADCKPPELVDRAQVLQSTHGSPEITASNLVYECMQFGCVRNI
jgi:hypothetical protein